MSTEAAIAALSDSAFPSIFIDTSLSETALALSERPLASLPMITAAFTALNAGELLLIPPLGSAPNTVIPLDFRMEHNLNMPPLN